MKKPTKPAKGSAQYCRERLANKILLGRAMAIGAVGRKAKRREGRS